MTNAGLKPHRGGLILTLGILSWVLLGPLSSFFAWFLGKSDMREMDAGRMDPDGRNLTQVGMILGMIYSILTIVGVLFVIVMLVLGIGLSVGGAAAS